MKRKVFINNVKNFHTEQKLLTETLPPFVALIVADENRITNDIKMTSSFEPNGSSVQKNFSSISCQKRYKVNWRYNQVC